MTTGRVRAKARVAVRAARAELGGRHIDAPAEHAVEVRISVEPELVEDLEDLLRRIEGRAIRGKDDVVTVPLPPGEDRATPRLAPVLDRWRALHPGIRIEVLPNTQKAKREFASAVGGAVGRGILSVATIAARLRDKRVPRRRRARLKD